jgi:hypothetical protein
MKKCSYCGTDCPDDAVVCPIDQTPFEETSSEIIPALTTPTTPTSPSPTLWNPNAAACWSLLFSPAFGAYLHARNAEVLGRADEAKSNKVWFYISVAFLVISFVTTFIPVIPDAPFRLAGIGILLGWYFSLGKKQIKYVKETWQDSYVRKHWKKPLLIAFGCLVGTFIALFVVAIIQEYLFGSQ